MIASEATAERFPTWSGICAVTVAGPVGIGDEGRQRAQVQASVQVCRCQVGRSFPGFGLNGFLEILIQAMSAHHGQHVHAGRARGAA